MFTLSKFAANPCIEGDGVAYNYSEVQQIVESMKSFVLGRNLILCICENNIPSMMGYIGFTINEQVLILVEGSQNAKTVNDVLAHYNPEFAWVPDRYIEYIRGSERVYQFGDYSLHRLLDSGQKRVDLPDNLQLLLSTSGSTGSKKFVRISRENLMANAASIIEYLGMRSDDVAITTLPFSYSFGLSIVNTHLLVGASIQITDLNPLSREFWEIVKNKKVTSLSGVPYTFEMLRRIKFERFELESIRYISQAGGKMGQEGLNYIKRVSTEKGWLCFVMYGQTEATARMSYLPPEYLETKLGSIGLPIPGGRIEIVDENGKEILESSVSGELVYLGSNVGMGYATCRGDLACADQWEGRLNTGDVGYRDQDGFLFITGRLKRFVKIFGNRVSLDDVETLLQSLFKNCEFVCFGQDDCLQIACVGVSDKNEVIALISKHLSIHRTAFKCQILDEIPRLSNGKVDYSLLENIQHAN